MRREEVIAEIEKLDGNSVHPQRIDEVESMLVEWNQSRLLSWKKSWVRKAVLIGMFGPLFIVFGLWKYWARHPSSLPIQSAPWVVPLVFISMIFFAWVYNRVKPKYASGELGMHTSCIKCKYDLDGLDSVLGDELWVGPAVCPECGQEYPAVGE
ncbi:MAG: hypothetical protein JKX70_03285 [Phycisphaerales bacterium]|nr:hypothetical protein [Phycisphaerales bacterium]